MTISEGVRFGPLLAGAFSNCILYGATVVQTYIYFQTFKRDKRWLKIFVIYLLICETFNSIFDIMAVFEPLVIRYGTARVFTHAPIMLSTNPLMTVLISLPVQLFIGWRVKVVNKSRVLPAIIAFLAIVSFIGGIATTVGVVHLGLEYSRFHDNSAVTIIWLMSSAAVDIIITASLVYSLSHKRTGYAATDDMINRIIRMTIQTGLLTAVCAILDVTLFLTLSGQTWNYIPGLTLSKLYSNTILSTLNARGGWKATSSTKDNVLFPTETGREGLTRKCTQIETRVTTDTQPQRPPSSAPMQFLELKDSCALEDPHSASTPEPREEV